MVEETLALAETLPVQDGGRIKPLSTYAGFTMLGLHGARSMKIDGDGGKKVTASSRPHGCSTCLFRPQFAIHQPTFRIDNSAALEAIGVKPRGKRDRYSYADIEPGREKLGELAAVLRAIDQDQARSAPNQMLDLAANLRDLREPVRLLQLRALRRRCCAAPARTAAPDKRADVSALMATAPQSASRVDAGARRAEMESRSLQDLLQQVLDAANFAKFGLFILPPADPQGRRRGRAPANAIMDVMSGTTKDPDSSHR